MKVSWLLVASLLLVLALAIACGDGDGNRGGSGPTADGTPAAADDEATPGAGADDNGDADVFPTPNTGNPRDDETVNEATAAAEEREAAFRAEARGLCPADSLEACAESYVKFAVRSEQAALCVNAAGHWFFEDPRGSVGKACSAADAVIVAIVGGE
jgi:hypothetical protein